MYRLWHGFAHAKIALGVDTSERNEYQEAHTRLPFGSHETSPIIWLDITSSHRRRYSVS